MLREELLERAEVHECLVHLHLSEVGVQRRVECETRADAVLEVSAGSAVVGCGPLERVPRVVRPAIRTAADRVRQDLEPLGRAHVADADQVGEAGDEPVLLFANEREHGLLVLPLDPAHEVHAPHLVLLLREAELGQRYPNLRRPPERIDGHRRLPHGIPRGVVERPIGADEDVPLHAGGVHDELERGPAIVVAVEEHAEFVAVAGRVAPREAPHDLCRSAVEQARADVHRGFVVEDAHLGRLGDCRTFRGVGLSEVGDRGRECPRGVVQPPVESRRPLCADGGHGVRRADRAPGERRRPVGRRRLERERGE